MARTILLAGILTSLAGVAYPMSQNQVRGRFLEPVLINERQVSILQNAAAALSSRIEATRKDISLLQTKDDFIQARNTLIRSLADGAAQVTRTQASFDEAAANRQAREASSIFFGDILSYYTDARGIVERSKPQMSDSIIASKTVIGLFEYNRRAYLRVANTRSATFNLDVESHPDKATISFRRKGDPYTRHSNPTNTTIKNRVYAIWYVKAQLEGHEDQEKPHDPYREDKHEVRFDMKPKKK